MFLVFSSRKTPISSKAIATQEMGPFKQVRISLMLVAARLRHVSATQWGLRKCMNVGLLTEMDREVAYAAD